MLNRGLFVKIIVILIFISIGYSIFNIKEFDLEFLVDKSKSTISVENIRLNGKVTRLPLNIYYINGKLKIGDQEYILTEYKKEDSPRDLKVDAYKIYFVDNNNSNNFYGYARVTGNILNDSVKSMYISVITTKKNIGSTHEENINAYIKK
ncbi:hypothetical protein [Paramaledivibacter caminithermalis]|jgi:hypothetical protein|uniref:Uncharacterized protein n=1 Tax=Paramaledivibacter caminithermalis (strain DSM 15212 / CIP 107654 / DViRD3) TaxID=1121301 RepID=A0A1M6U343_PARC5|nr:hypothetical protein [Paramaledivibacter caminithermalis]SHK63580.1 hypothetical protein SAMN02745912_03860 [Paramaledivibacter caminithermalis DSM 15212]